MGYKIKVSDHALDRLRERSGLNKRSVQKVAERAYNKGLKHSEVSGHIYKYVSSITSKSSKGTDIRLYGDKIFIFNKNNPNKEDDNKVITLVTVLQLPTNIVKKLNCIKDKDNT